MSPRLPRLAEDVAPRVDVRDCDIGLARGAVPWLPKTPQVAQIWGWIRQLAQE
jgi:hypothetical protein